MTSLLFLDNTLLWYNRENLLQPPVYYCLSSAGDYEIGHRTECLLDLYFSQNNFPLTLHDLVDSGIEWHIQRNLDYVASSFFGSNAWDMVLSQPIS